MNYFRGDEGAFGYPAASERGELIFGAAYATGVGIFTPRSIIVATGGQLPPPGTVNNSAKAMVGNNQALSTTKNSKLQKCAFKTVST